MGSSGLSDRQDAETCPSSLTTGLQTRFLLKGFGVWKWNTPVWSHNGNVVAVGAFGDHVKVNFFKGASLDDPHDLFNAGLEAKVSRAIDIHEGERINAAALQDLVRAAVALNRGGPKQK